VGLVIEIGTLLAGAIMMLAALPPSPERRRAKRRTAPVHRPEDLERIERLVVAGRYSALEVHSRLSPMLREIAITRLGPCGIALDRSPAAARERLGEELFELVRGDRPPPENPRGSGVSLEQLTGFVERLEQL
jgi:hypothetical protein